MHKQCIKNWILSENNNNPTHCEVCLGQYCINFDEMFAEEFVRYNINSDEEIQNSDEEVTEGHREEFEINIAPEQIEYATAIQNAPQYIIHSTPVERVRVARQTRQRFTRRDHLIKERCFAIFLLMIIMDGILAISYDEVCRYDRQCQFDIICVSATGTLFALCGMGYFSYSYCIYHNFFHNMRG